MPDVEELVDPVLPDEPYALVEVVISSAHWPYLRVWLV